MKVVYILKKDADETAQSIINEHRKEHDVTVIDIRIEKDYVRIVNHIRDADNVISW